MGARDGGEGPQGAAAKSAGDELYIEVTDQINSTRAILVCFLDGGGWF
jgi:hypothetical protein